MTAAPDARQFTDELVTAADRSLPERFFDRMMFNLHPAEATSSAALLPTVIVGAGVYPARDTTDGYVMVVLPGEQRNVRFSTELGAARPGGVGPLRWSVTEPLRSWRLVLEDNPTGCSFDVVWTARTQPLVQDVEVANAADDASSFTHLVQSGRYTGRLTVDGRDHDVTGWFGQRDRSRGIRTMAGGQGLHVWFQAQFPRHCVSFLLVEARDGDRLLLEGAVLCEDGTIDSVTDVAHDLLLDDGLDLRSGRVRVRTAAGREHVVEIDASGRGVHMAGGGYGGSHGRPLGVDHLEHDAYRLDGSVTPRGLDTALTDRPAVLTSGGERGVGIVEFAATRSSAYRYRPTL